MTGADETRGNKIFIKSDPVHDNDKSTRVPKSRSKSGKRNNKNSQYSGDEDMRSADNYDSADADNEMTMYKKQEMSFVQGRRSRRGKRRPKKTVDSANSAGEMSSEGEDDEQEASIKEKHAALHDTGEFLDR